MKLKFNLLLPILENTTSTNKYSRAFLNLKNVLDLEKRNNHIFEDEDHVYSSFQELEKKFNNFIDGIPLIVIERYYKDNMESPRKTAFLMYKGKELDELQIMEMYDLLEQYFAECFALACIIADMYNLEIKINSQVTNKRNDKSFF